jgi:beta-phosphoglucomutase
MIQSIVFDFDGVIVDTEPLHYRAFLRAMEPFGIDFDYDRYVQQYIGYDDRDGLRAICNDFDAPLSDSQINELIQQKAGAFEQIVGEGVTPFPGAVELILAAAKKMPIAICSGALRRDIDAVLRGVGDGDLLQRFNVIVTADEVPHSKPDPRSYQLAAERLSLPAADCLAIEDTPAGLASARGAGLRTLAVAHSYEADRLDAADRVEDSLAGVTLEKLLAWFA